MKTEKETTNRTKGHESGLVSIRAIRGVDSSISRYFLPYQIEAILDESRLNLWEKSIRIGASYSMAFRAVRRRVMGAGDCLVTSVSLPAAKEFIEQCRRFDEIFKLGASAIEDVRWGEALNEAGFCITYPNGGRIFAFSSNPKAIRSFGGEVCIDEFAFHQDPKEMLKAAGGRAMWGFPITIWSSHNGADSEWNRILTEEKAKGAESKWKIRTTTLFDALDAGLLEKINETRGLSMTRDEFVAQTRTACGSEEAFNEECLCQPRRGGAGAIGWQHIEEAKKDFDAVRFHVANDDAPHALTAAEAAIAALGKDEPASLGFDVARTGDLAAIWIGRKTGDKHRLAALITMKQCRFPTMFDTVARIMEKRPALVGAGDKTGMGMQICEDLEERFGQARFIGINFGSLKPDLGTRLAKMFESGAVELPRGERWADLYADLSGIRVEPLPSGRLHYYESRNPLNKDSHCDMAWAAALALMAAAENENLCGVW